MLIFSSEYKFWAKYFNNAYGDLTNADVISAGQLEFDYNSTQGVIIDGAIAIGQASSHIISFNEDTSNPVSVHVTIMFYSMSGETISAGSGNIIVFF